MTKQKKKKIRLTGREKKILAERKKDEELLRQKTPIEEAAESQYLTIQRKLEERFDKVQKFSSSIRKDYLDKKQKGIVLRELKKEIIDIRELSRKIYGLNYLFLEQLYHGKEREKKKRA